MYRAALLSIVLVLAIGPNSVLLCAWCEPGEETAFACDHHDAAGSPRLSADDACGTAPAITRTFVRDEARRGTPTPDAAHASALPRFLFAARPGILLQARDAAAAPLASAPPLLIALRI